jgi:hypothetical protein
VNGSHQVLSDLLQADRPGVCFVSNIGDSVLALPTLRALGEMFTAPITLICPKVVFDLCFREVSPLHVDTTGLPLTGPRPSPPSTHRTRDYEALASEIGPVDVFIDTLTDSPRCIPSRSLILCTDPMHGELSVTAPQPGSLHEFLGEAVDSVIGARMAQRSLRNGCRAANRRIIRARLHTLS